MKAYVTFGLPGAGKTTYLKNHYNHLPIVSADEIKMTLPNFDLFNPSLCHQESVRLAKEKVLTLSDDGVEFAWDSGSINSKYSRNIFKELYSRGYFITLIVFNTPLEVCLERNRQRPFKVPEDNILEKDQEKTEAFQALLPYVGETIYV
jgi:predicted kinase